MAELLSCTILFAVVPTSTPTVTLPDDPPPVAPMPAVTTVMFPPISDTPVSPFNVILLPTVTVLVDLLNVNPPVALDVPPSLKTTSVFAPGALVVP